MGRDDRFPGPGSGTATREKKQNGGGSRGMHDVLSCDASWAGDESRTRSRGTMIHPRTGGRNVSRSSLCAQLKKTKKVRASVSSGDEGDCQCQSVNLHKNSMREDRATVAEIVVKRAERGERVMKEKIALSNLS